MPFSPNTLNIWNFKQHQRIFEHWQPISDKRASFNLKFYVYFSKSQKIKELCLVMKQEMSTNNLVAFQQIVRNIVGKSVSVYKTEVDIVLANKCQLRKPRFTNKSLVGAYGRLQPVNIHLQGVCIWDICFASAFSRFLSKHGDMCVGSWSSYCRKVWLRKKLSCIYSNCHTAKVLMILLINAAYSQKIK